MRLRFAHIVFLVAATLWAAGSPTPLSAGSGLIRLTDRDDLFGWEAVGRVEIGGNGYCTGVLIAPDKVLTAAHCVYNKGRAVEASSLTFRAGLRDGKAIAERSVARVVAHKQYDPKLPFGAETIRYDAALLELSEPISSAVASPFKLHQGIGKGSRVSVVSYGRGRDEALSWQRDCGVLGRWKDLIAFDCNITFGSSGAPVFVREGTRARILSLVSGGNMGSKDPVAYGMELPKLVDSLKRDLRAMPKPWTGGARTRELKFGNTRRNTGAKFARPAPSIIN